MSKSRDHAQSQRQLRVGEELRHALAQIFAKQELRDPDLAAVSITVGEVRCTPDLRTARVYVTPLGGGEVSDVVAALRRATPFLRGQIGRTVHLKYVPDLLFEPDDTFAYAERIDRLLRETGPETADAESAEAEDDGA